MYLTLLKYGCEIIMTALLSTTIECYTFLVHLCIEWIRRRRTWKDEFTEGFLSIYFLYDVIICSRL